MSILHRSGGGFEWQRVCGRDYQFRQLPHRWQCLSDRPPASTYTACFVFELNPNIYGGSSLLYSTYLGGTTGSDSMGGLTLDALGNIYVIGTAGPLTFR